MTSTRALDARESLAASERCVLIEPHVSAPVEIENRAARVRIRRAHPFGLDATRADDFALDVGIDREHARHLLEPCARLFHARIRIEDWLRPEHFDDRLKLLLRHRVLPPLQ
jgi:hypothetical protein